MRPVAPSGASQGTGTRKRLDHIDAMRPIKQAAVISTHALIFLVPAAAVTSQTNLLILTHFSREAFLFVSSCMLAYGYRELSRIGSGVYWKRRLMSVGAPYVTWTVIYFLFTSLVLTRGFPFYAVHGGTIVGGAGLLRFGNLLVSGYYHLYYLIVIMEFYAIFPLLLRLVRRFASHPVRLVLVALAWQLTNAVFWPDIYSVVIRLHIAGATSQSFWESRLVTSYAFYLVAGIVVAMHLNDVHDWIVTHRALILLETVVAAATAILLNLVHFSGFTSRLLHAGSDPFAIITIPYVVGAILCVYLLGVYLVDPQRSLRTRAITKSGSDNSYGIYLSQMLWIPMLVRVHEHLLSWVPWPIATASAVIIVYTLGYLFSVVMARTPVARLVTGRSRVPWPSLVGRRPVAPDAPDVADGPLDVGLVS